jgi:hypothetical protein
MLEILRQNVLSELANIFYMKGILSGCPGNNIIYLFILELIINYIEHFNQFLYKQRNSTASIFFWSTSIHLLSYYKQNNTN